MTITLPNTKDIISPISIILDSRWLQLSCLGLGYEFLASSTLAFEVFFFFGEERKHVANKDEFPATFATYLRTWKNIHCRIISWFSNTFVVSISCNNPNLPSISCSLEFRNEKLVCR